jgi:hypothetical protein
MDMWRWKMLMSGLGAAVLAVPAPAVAAAGSWSAVAIPDPAAQFTTLKSVDSRTDGDAWAVGDTSPPTGGGFKPVALHWTGGAWRATAVPAQGKGTTLWGVSASRDDDAWAVGSFFLPQYRSVQQATALHWDGTAWTPVAVPNASILMGVVAIAPDNAWAIGSGGVKHWNGTAWSDVTTPSPGGIGSGSLHAIAAGPAGDVWVVGSYAPRRHQTASFSLHYTGGTWQVVPMPAGSTSPWGVVAIAANDAWAVGEVDGLGSVAPLTSHWDGTAWSTVPAPTVPAGSYLRAVTARTGEVWAVGVAFTGEAGVVAPLTMRWNGSSWTSVTAPPSGSDLWSVSSRPGNARVWAVGETPPGVGVTIERH